MNTTRKQREKAVFDLGYQIVLINRRIHSPACKSQEKRALTVRRDKLAERFADLTN